MKSKAVICLAGILTSLTVAAASSEVSNLHAERINVVHRYIDDLGAANLPDMLSLFDKNGLVVSTSKGEMRADAFFSAFIPEMTDAKIEAKQTFESLSDANHLSVRFHFAFQLKNGEYGEAEYVDEFIFTEHSNKLAKVIMFENKKFNHSIDQ